VKKKSKGNSRNLKEKKKNAFVLKRIKGERGQLGKKRSSAGERKLTDLKWKSI